MNTGAFAQEVIVDPSQIHRIPKSLPFDIASLLACGVITGVGAVINTAKIKPRSTIAVIGVGGVGLNTIQGARLSGASRIFAVDINQDHLNQAKQFGATDLVLANKNAYQIIRELTDGRGVDFVFVTVGVGEVFNTATKYLAPKGELIVVGLPESDFVGEWSPVAVSGKELTIKGSRMGGTILKRDIPYLLDLYAKGELELDQLIADHYSIEQINEAIDALKQGVTGRNIIMF